MSVIGTALESIANIGIYEYKRWRESNSLQQAALIKVTDRAIAENDVHTFRSLAPSLIKIAGLKPDMIDAIEMSLQAGAAADDINWMKRSAPQPTPSMSVTTPEVFERVPATERTKKRTAATQEGTAEGVLKAREDTLERRQNLELLERTSKTGRTLFERKVADEIYFDKQKRIAAAEFGFNTEWRTEYNEAGAELRQEYERDKKGHWKKKGAPVVVQRSAVQRDKIAIMNAITRLTDDLNKLDEVDYNDTMKMALVRALEQQYPTLGGNIRKMEVASAEGKQRLKDTIGFYLDLLIDAGNFTEEEEMQIREMVKPTKEEPAIEEGVYIQNEEGKWVLQ